MWSRFNMTTVNTSLLLFENNVQRDRKHLESPEQGSQEGKSIKEKMISQTLRTSRYQGSIGLDEKKMVKWAAETKLFLLTQSDLWN